MSVSPIIIKYAVPALFGAATKTYLDYQRSKATVKQLLVSLIMNSIVAVGVGAFSAHAFVGEYPGKEHFGYAIAFFSGAVGINIILGISAIDWKEVILSRVNK